ncbi:carbohydrate kinase family protein [Agromyces aerolatus]|uniref:carbohydrate kinase family protein n=1 Tax=Agromyces sp. LY-1074 TaxID=3074080 RepID=UPI00285B6586|nr:MULTISPECIES: carbohydrate kinase family protein [unclassified Agromyces]MDR5700880.1 carbohydrate kinase family protein [Agromyces sp. LY-1074]MDR5707459.1 carbohydrate kinase family protein [Agromyces sp. LY-1358]
MRSDRRTLDVLSVGDASVDYFVQVPHIARADDKAIGRLLGVHGGGMSANLAVAAAYCGARTGLITAYGSDDRGARQIEELQSLGVDTSQSIGLPDAEGWFCVVQLDATGEKALVGVETDVKIPRAAEVHDDALRSSRVVVPLADDVPWALDLARRAREAGALVAVDLEPSTVDGDWRDLEALLGLTEVVFANRATIERVAGGDFERAAETFRRFGARIVVLTDGRRGATCSTSDGSWSASTRVETVADTTGAGDALAGAFIGSWIRGADLPSSLRAGVAVSSLCVEHVGARSYAPSVPADSPIHIRRLEGVRLSQEASDDTA